MDDIICVEHVDYILPSTDPTLVDYTGYGVVVVDFTIWVTFLPYKAPYE